MKALKKLNITGMLTQAAGNVAGAYGAALVTNVIVPKALPTADAKVSNMIAFGAGVLLPAFIGGRKKNPMIEDVAAGIRATAGMQILQEFVPGLPGIGTIDNGVFPINDRINGARGWYDEGEIYDSSVAALPYGQYNELEQPDAIAMPVV